MVQYGDGTVKPGEYRCNDCCVCSKHHDDRPRARPESSRGSPPYQRLAAVCKELLRSSERGRH